MTHIFVLGCHTFVLIVEYAGRKFAARLGGLRIVLTVTGYTEVPERTETSDRLSVHHPLAYGKYLFTEHQILLAAQKMCTATEMPQLDSLVSAAIRGHEDKKSAPRSGLGPTGPYAAN